MKFIDYVREKLIAVIILLFSVCTIEIFLLPYPIHDFIRWYIPICILGTFFIMAIIEFIKKKQFYETTLNKLNALDQKYLINEVIEEPHFTEGKILKEILNDTDKAMLEHVNSYKYAQEEYREYIELWIHEVKTPIATSKMIIENNQNAVTKNIEEELEKIDKYVEQALFYARSNHLEKDYHIKRIPLKEVIHAVLLKNQKELLEKKIQIEIEDIGQEIYTDSKWLEFILDQIITNSMKYIKKDPCISITTQKQKNCVILCLKDNGIGISKEEIGRVFEKGFTGNNGRVTNKKATGIGLYLCKKLCKKLGHQITIQSELGKETTIRIVFPIGNHSNLTN